MRILDRYILKSFMVNYLLALGVLVGMYVLLDLIVNVQDFAKGAAPPPPPRVTATAPATPGATAASIPATIPDTATQPAAVPPATALSIVSDMANYYAYQMLVIFQMVSGIIPLLAAGFTMVRMTRHHELTAMLSSGVSLYRVAAPIIVLSMTFSVLNIVNQEFIISQPYVIEKLLRKHDEVNQAATRVESVNYVLDDRDNSLLSAREYDATSSPKMMKDIFIVQRDKATSIPTGHIVAASATWEIPEDQTTEAWVMHNVLFENDRPDIDIQQRIAQKSPKMTYYTTITPEQLDLIAQKKAVDFLSSAQVRRLAEYSPKINQPMLYKIMHLRFTQPLMNVIMLLIGIPFLLTREPGKLVINMFNCVLISGTVFIATFVIFQMAGTHLNLFGTDVYMDPLLAAWLPVLIFGPLALVMMDMIHT